MFILALLGYTWWAATRPPLQLVERDAPDEARDGKPQRTAALRYLSTTFEALHKWVPRGDGGEKDPTYKQLHLHVFRSHCEPLYLAFEATCGMLLGVFEGLQRRDLPTCRVAAYGVTVTTFALAIAGVASRPMLVRFDGGFLFLSSLLAVAASLTLTVGVQDDNNYGIQNVSDVLSIIGMLGSAAKVALVVAVAMVLHFVRRPEPSEPIAAMAQPSPSNRNS